MASEEITAPLQLPPRPIEDRLKSVNAEMQDLNEIAENLNRESQQLLGQLGKGAQQPLGADTTAMQSP
jgi:hypothetical protein